MMLSRLACILIYVCTTQVAAAQPTAGPFGSNAIDVHLARLRSKLAGPVRIETVRGVGYRIVAS
jgi:hypothetical protein